MFAFSYSFTHSAVYVFSVHSKSVGFFLVTIAKAFAFAFGRASSSKFFSKFFWRNRKTISFSKTKRPGAFCYILLMYAYYVCISCMHIMYAYYILLTYAYFTYFTHSRIYYSHISRINIYTYPYLIYLYFIYNKSLHS